MCMQLRIIYDRYGNENIWIAMETIANRKEQFTQRRMSRYHVYLLLTKNKVQLVSCLGLNFVGIQIQRFQYHFSVMVDEKECLISLFYRVWNASEKENSFVCIDLKKRG